jgi:hypothetical protein
MITGFKTTFNKKPLRTTISKEQTIDILNIAKDIVTSVEYLQSSEKNKPDYKYILAIRKYYPEPNKENYLKGLKWSLMKLKDNEQIKALLEELKVK